MIGVEPYEEGRLVGRYRIVRLIGEGGMGAVYEATHVLLKKRVAVKVLLPHVAKHPEARARFLREGEAASRINHPHVVSVLDVGEDADAPYLVMEYLEGRALSEFLAERGALEVVEAADLFLPILAAVAAGHDCGVVHRDLKPQNIFLARGRWGEPTPKVLDFGVSKLIDHEGPPVTRTETVLGTACYMSPEQARGARHVEARSDQFALGLLLYEMLTGRRAYLGANDLEVLHNAAAGTVQPARQLRPGLPEALYLLLDRMLAMAPSDRFPGLRDGGRLLLPFVSEKIRSSIGGDFVTPPVASVETSEERAPRPPASDPVARTALLPTMIEELRENTTLRHAAIESRPRAPAKRTSRPALKLAAALAVPAMVLAAFIVWRSSGDQPARAPAAPLAPAVAVAGPPEPPPPVAAAAPADEPAAAPVPFEVRAFPPEADLALDGQPPSRGRLELVLPLAGDAHELRVSAPGYAAKEIAFGAGQSPPSEIRLEPTAAPVQAARKKKALRAAKPPQAKRGTNDALIIR